MKSQPSTNGNRGELNIEQLHSTYSTGRTSQANQVLIQKLKTFVALSLRLDCQRLSPDDDDTAALMNTNTAAVSMVIRNLAKSLNHKSRY